MTNQNGAPFNEEKFARNFDKMDEDHDGKVDMQELFRFMQAKAIKDGQLTEEWPPPMYLKIF